MFTNTLTLTINAVARTLVRVNQDNYGSEYSYKDAVESITMKIRHSVDQIKDSSKISGFARVNRHNVTLERIVYATPTVTEKQYTCTVTIREAEGSDPAELLKTWEGFNTLVLTLDNGMVVGEN